MAQGLVKKGKASTSSKASSNRVSKNYKGAKKAGPKALPARKQKVKPLAEKARVC
jgi:hypothetical protein